MAERTDASFPKALNALITFCARLTAGISTLATSFHITISRKNKKPPELDRLESSGGPDADGIGFLARFAIAGADQRREPLHAPYSARFSTQRCTAGKGGLRRGFQKPALASA